MYGRESVCVYDLVVCVVKDGVESYLLASWLECLASLAWPHRLSARLSRCPHHLTRLLAQRIKHLCTIAIR